MLAVQSIGSVQVLKARNSLVGECLQHCQQAVRDCFANKKTFLVLDLSESPTVNSDGLEFIVDTQQECLSHGGRFVIAEPQPLCKEVLEITGISDYVAVFPDLRSALSDFAK